MLGYRGPQRPTGPQAGRSACGRSPVREAQACQSVEKAGCPLPGPWQATEVAEEAHGSWCLQNGPVLTEQERQRVPEAESVGWTEATKRGPSIWCWSWGGWWGKGQMTAGRVSRTLDSTSAIHSTNTHPEPAPRQAQC